MTKWDPAMATGVADIDTQHQEFFRRAELLEDALAQGQSAAMVGEMLLYLRGYCHEHFASEGRLMRDRAYPAAAKHVSEHAWFSAQLDSLQRTIAARGPSDLVAMRITELISDWWVTHLRTTDMALREFIQAGDPPSAR